MQTKAAGNESKNIDKHLHYPNDWANGKEIVDNFILVGATSKIPDEHFVASFSNYGKEQVDLFAPGKEVYTAHWKNTYNITQGTSFASPIVAYVAALIRSHYPKLTAPEVKQILLNSGTPYDLNIEIKQEDGTKSKVPFSKLSKSGKVVNAYQALLMAKILSKKWIRIIRLTFKILNLYNFLHLRITYSLT
ncbi:S8 family serine peptidase [Aquimarina sp. ERC-38]|uniref:S8 family serine peptidase n=1 Tax=Aquimarina sp. ERC-38 TaxID=2949996 RepID=UPI002247DE92|nr:S8 family serine peptidase [Aquimarina sp. ERC-38]UZO82182.1 S8 family serine peptidase [Aquimarina sp. ERC-38]